jgi:hypothetical protein
MMEREGAERQLSHIVRKGEGVLDIVVLIENGRSGFGRAESRNWSDFNCGDSLLIFVVAAFRGLDWRADVDNGRRLLGDTWAGDEAINNGLNLGPTCLTKIHFDVPVHIIKDVVPVRYLGDAMYCFIFRKIEIGIGPFLPGLGGCWDSYHVGR